MIIFDPFLEIRKNRGTGSVVVGTEVQLKEFIDELKEKYDVFDAKNSVKVPQDFIDQKVWNIAVIHADNFDSETLNRLLVLGMSKNCAVIIVGSKEDCERILNNPEYKDLIFQKVELS